MFKNKILVAYATRAGSTVEVAQTIGQVLSASGAQVDLKPVKGLRDVNGYDAAIIGSAIRMGQWLPEAVQFVKTNRDALSRMPTAFFLVSGTLRNDTPEVRQAVSANLNPVRRILEPARIGLFAGKIEFSKLSFLARCLAQTMKQPEGDWRNWEAIRAWTRALEQTFAHSHVAVG